MKPLRCGLAARSFAAVSCAALALGAMALTACGPRLGSTPTPSVSELRASTKDGADDQTLARWLLAELVSPGGSADGAKKARQKLDAVGSKHYLAHLARALDDRLHGRARSAPDHFL